MNGRDEQDDQQHENGRTVEDGLAEPVRLHRERRERHRRDGERSPGENLAMIGALGCWSSPDPDRHLRRPLDRPHAG